jgi:hypothetical protein
MLFDDALIQWVYFCLLKATPVIVLMIWLIQSCNLIWKLCYLKIKYNNNKLNDNNLTKLKYF